MTLIEVASRHKISAKKLANALNISENKTNVRLGLLKKQYKFTMNDVREQVVKIKRNN